MCNYMNGERLALDRVATRRKELVVPATLPAVDSGGMTMTACSTAVALRTQTLQPGLLQRLRRDRAFGRGSGALWPAWVIRMATSMAMATSSASHWTRAT